jgi:diguanylate cyclase (GGDEF)-like protein
VAQGDPWAGFSQQKGEDPWAGFSQSKGEDPWAGFGGGTATAAPPDTRGFEINPEEPGGVKQRSFMFRGPGTAPEEKNGVSAKEVAQQFAARGLESMGGATKSMVRGAEIAGRAVVPRGFSEQFFGNAPAVLSPFGAPQSFSAEDQRKAEEAIAQNRASGALVKPVEGFEERAGPIAKFATEEVAPVLGGVVPYAGPGLLTGGGGFLAGGIGAAMGAAQSAGGMYDRVLQETGDEGKAMEAAIASAPGGALVGSMSAGAVGRLPIINKITKGLAGDLLLHAGTLGLGSGVQGALDAQIRKRLAGEDLDAWDEAWKAAKQGAIAGGILRATGMAGEAVGAIGGKAAPKAGTAAIEEGPAPESTLATPPEKEKKAPPTAEGTTASGLPERIPSDSGQGTVPQEAGAGGPEEIDLGDRRAVERQGQPERRQNTELRQKLNESDQEAALKALRLHGQGDELGALAVMQEQNKARTEAVAAAHEEARTDALTGLPNKREWAERDLTGKSVISGDLDGLKWVNDNLGHEAGNKYLKAVADVVRQEDPEGKFARVGGDEFNGEGDTRPEAEDLAKRIQDRLANTTVDLGVHNGERIVKQGIGISFGHGDTEGEADKAMYENKAQRAEQGLRRADNKQEPPGIVRTPEAETPTEPGAAAEISPIRPAAAEPLPQEAAAPTSPPPPEGEAGGEPPKAEEKATEPAPEGLPTSTKNAITEQERAMRGESPLEQALRKSFGESLDTARAAIEQDPSLTQRIVEGKPTPELTRDEREAALAHEKVTAHNEYERVRDAALAEKDNPDAFAALDAQRQKLSDRLLEIDAATKGEGTETGRALAIRKMMLARDYSIAAIETEFRVAKGGDQLTSAEQAKAQSLSERLIAAEKQVDEIEANLAKQREAPAAPERSISTRSKIISYLDAQAEQARARLASKRRQASGGIPFDPADIADVARIAASHIAHGIDAAARLVTEFGESIKPHLQEILARAKQIHEEAPKQAGSEKAAITRATKTAGLLRAKTAAGDFEAAPKPEPLPMTKERLAAKTDLEEARREYESAKGKFRFQNRTKLQKARDAAREALTLPRQMMASFDLSATLFQGGLQSATHPIISAKALGESVRSFMSERRALEVDTALRNRPNAAAGDKAGLELTRLEGPLSTHEEQMRSNWAGKIPFIGKGIEASNRAFTTFLNVQRALTFDKLTDAMPDKSPEAQNAAANFINVSTGRGYTPAKFRSTMSAAANVLWSPRLWLSRMQLLAGQPLYRGTAASRRAIAGEYAKGLIALGGVYSLAALAGGKIEDDPRSSNFGKIKSGNVYLDPTLGMAQNVTLLSRLVTGQTKTQGGKIEPLRAPIFGKGKGPTFGQSTTADVLGRFLRTKLSPTLGIPIDIASGSNVAGQPVSLKSGLASGLVPMSFMDIYQAMQDGGVPEATAIGLLSIFGAHVQVRQPNKPGHASAGR